MRPHGDALHLGRIASWAVALLLSLTAAGGLLAAEPGGPVCLVLWDERTQRPLWRISSKTGETFAVRFLHSYERFPVEELYGILGPGRIVFRGLLSRSMLNGQGFRFAGAHIRPDGWLEIEGVELVKEKVEFIMGAQEHADHRIEIGGKEHRLSEGIQPGTSVVVEAKAGLCPPSPLLNQETDGDGR